MELVNQALQWLDTVYRTRSQPWTYGWLEPHQVPDGSLSAALDPGTVYFTLTMQSMRVVDVRRGLTRFYGIVHSYVAVPHRSGQAAKFNTVIAPDILQDVDSKHIDRVITVGKPLVGPIPYYGDIDVQLGLFSVVSENLAARFITLLDGMSQIAGVSYISAALPYVEPLKQGISLLTQLGNDDSILEIGLSTTFQALQAGWFFVMRAPKEKIIQADLRVTPGDCQLVDAAGNSIENYPYMVFQVTARPDRKADWFMIPELSKAYNELQGYVRKRRYEYVEESLAAFKAITYTCNDLIETDRDVLVDKVEAEVKKTMGRRLTAMEKLGEEDQLPPLRDIKLYL